MRISNFLFVDGDLENLLDLSRKAKTRFSEEDITKLILQVGKVLQWAAMYDTKHLTLEPKNIFLTEDGDWKVAGWGQRIDHKEYERYHGKKNPDNNTTDKNW